MTSFVFWKKVPHILLTFQILYQSFFHSNDGYKHNQCGKWCTSSIQSTSTVLYSNQVSFNTRSPTTRSQTIHPFLRGAALLIGLWDLIIHSVALCTLILMLGRAPRPDLGATNEQLSPRQVLSFADSNHGPPPTLMLTKESFPSSDILWNRFLEKHNVSHASTEVHPKNFYTHLNLLTMKWTQSLSQRE